MKKMSICKTARGFFFLWLYVKATTFYREKIRLKYYFTCPIIIYEKEPFFY